MDGRYGPGSTSRLEGGSSGSGEEPLTGLAAIAQYGEGKQDADGRFEFYNLPAGHAATRPKSSGEAVAWLTIFEQPDLLISDFHSEYGIHLEQVLTVLPWRDFESRVTGLLAADTRLGRFFAPKKPDTSKSRRSY